MPVFSNWNGRIEEENSICISPNNRSFRYGDGCFETMKVNAGKILLAEFHFQRLFISLQTLGFTIPSTFTARYLNDQVENLVKLNGHERLARVRLVAYRGDGGLYELENKNVNFIIQSWPGKKESNYFNETGLNVGISADTKIAADHFSRIKSNNYLRHSMAARFAQEMGLDDCILTNAFNRIADSTIATVFLIVNEMIMTPALSEGSVDGVMRRYLLEAFERHSVPFVETEIGLQELLVASEVFLTNAIFGIRWVKKIGDRLYTNSTSNRLYNTFIAPQFSPSTF
jgi:branched-subunit amino acid aminotransferase/4-amino-4-deoxychorismate lyase